MQKEVFFGGAAGGGKSDALLMAALQFVMYSNYHAILFRKTFADLALPEALMSRSKEWLMNTDARWSSATKTWHFPSGATISFGYLDHENTKYRYQSAAFQFVGFDELTQFTEGMYTYLFSRNRKEEGSPIPLRTRAASNPGGLGHLWVKGRFIDPSPQKARGERIYIPSRLEDNPYLDTEAYEQNLNELALVQREQLRHGDWSIVESGNLFKTHWFKLIERLPPDLQYIRFWDLAATEKKRNSEDPDWTVGVKMGVDPRGKLYIADVIREQISPDGVDRLISNTAIRDGRNVMIYMEQEGGASGKLLVNHYKKMLSGFGFRGIRPTGDKVTRCLPYSYNVEHGNVYVLKAPWNEDYFFELNVFPNGSHDDQVDASSGAFNQLVTQAETIEFARV